MKTVKSPSNMDHAADVIAFFFLPIPFQLLVDLVLVTLFSPVEKFLLNLLTQRDLFGSFPELKRPFLRFSYGDSFPSFRKRSQ